MQLSVGTWHVIFHNTCKSAITFFLIMNLVLEKIYENYNSAHKMVETLENSGFY